MGLFDYGNQDGYICMLDDTDFNQESRIQKLEGEENGVLGLLKQWPFQLTGVYAMPFVRRKSKPPTHMDDNLPITLNF